METQGKGKSPIRVSLIIAVLNSHGVVRRQLFHFRKMNIDPYSSNYEIIIMDDGSDPGIYEYLCSISESANPLSYKNYGASSSSSPGDKLGSVQVGMYHIIKTGDQRPWSQPCARNAGARIAQGKYLFMTDIDHIISREAFEAALMFEGDKMVFPREWAILDRHGRIRRDPDVLSSYGLINGKGVGSHANTFVMRKSIFDKLGGYDEKFCGKYGGDDTDLARRYGELHYAGQCERSVTGPPIYVYPEPRQDVKKIFHNLRR